MIDDGIRLWHLSIWWYYFPTKADISCVTITIYSIAYFIYIFSSKTHILLLCKLRQFFFDEILKYCRVLNDLVWSCATPDINNLSRFCVLTHYGYVSGTAKEPFFFFFFFGAYWSSLVKAAGRSPFKKRSRAKSTCKNFFEKAVVC